MRLSMLQHSEQGQSDRWTTQRQHWALRSQVMLYKMRKFVDDSEEAERGEGLAILTGSRFRALWSARDSMAALGRCPG